MISSERIATHSLKTYSGLKWYSKYRFWCIYNSKKGCLTTRNRGVNPIPYTVHNSKRGIDLRSTGPIPSGGPSGNGVLQ